MNSIERTQYQAALAVYIHIAVSGTRTGTNTSNLYDELGWESLSERRWFYGLVQFFKLSYSLIPSYFRDLIPPPRPMVYGHRNEHVLLEYPVKL